MALNQNKVQSIHDNINSLDVQKGMQTAVVSIQKDIFDVFTENTVRVTDKKDIIKLEQGLIESIDRMHKSIETHSKSDKDKIDGIEVKKAKKHIANISAQIDVLVSIKDTIKQINEPATISQASISPKQTSASLSIQDVVKDSTDIHFDIAERGYCSKYDADRHNLNLTKIEYKGKTSRQIQHNNSIIGHIYKKDAGWTTEFQPGQIDKILELGIKEIKLPFTMRKSIDLTDPSTGNVTKNFVEKTKTWKINLEQLQGGSTTSTTPVGKENDPSGEETKEATPTGERIIPSVQKEDPIDTIDQKMDQLLKIVNMSDMRMQYNNLKVRWDTLKMHMQNFNRNQDLNADTPLFKSIFPALEHEVNEFKKQLTNGIIDAQDKLDRVKNSGIADLEKIKQLQQDIEDIKAKYKIIQDEFDIVHKDLFERIYKKTPKQLPPHEETPTIVLPTGGEEEPSTDEPTTSETINISAHVMDKESLVKKSIEQDVLEEYQHKYDKRRWPKRFAMYTYARWRQNNRVNNRISLAKDHNDAIETDMKRQLRIASSIGNFAYENDLGLGGDKVKKTEIGSNNQVNDIANQYIKGSLTRTAAAEQFNDFFKNNPDFQAGMTGTNIMEQLDETALIVAISPHIGDSTHPRDYRAIQQKMSLLAASNPNMKIHGVKISNAVSKTEMDKVCDYTLAYKSRSAIANLQNITANIKLYKIEKDTADLTESKLREQNKTRKDKALAIANGATFGLAGSTRGNAILKTATGVGLATGGVGALGVVGGVAGMAAALQWMKTYRDYLTEAQKTHEDAMTMGTKELDSRIKELEAQIKKHNAAQKTLAFWGFGKHAIRTKQLNILKAVNGKMHQTGSIKPAAFLIQEMQHSSRDRQAVAIAETLARLKMGRELDTNFISGSTRALTEQERKDLIVQLKQSAQQRAKKVGYEHVLPYTEEEEWKDFSAKLLSIPKNNIGAIYQRRCDDLKKNFDLMKEDINKGRKKMARRDAGTNLATSVTVAGVAAGVSAGIHALNGGTSGVDGTTVQGPHNEYALGKYETPLTDKASGWENALNNGDKVSFQGEAAVDAVNASRGTFGDLGKEVAEVTKLAGSFDTTTQDAVREALTTELAKVKAEAIKAGADAGNVALTQQRWVDGVEEMLTKLQAAGKTGVTIENIKFDPSTFDPIDIQASAAAGSGVSMQDVIDRSVAFEATIGGTTGTWGAGEPLWVVWPGFSNTYANPGKENDGSDSWSKRTKDLEKKQVEEKQKEEENDDYNQDFERKYGNGEPYVPVPPVQDKKKHREDKWKDNEGKPFEEPTDAPQDHPYGEKEDKRGVSPRGREGSRRESDVPKYFEKEYPQQPSILSPEQAAEKIIAAKIRGLPLGDMPFVSDSRYEMGQYTAQIEDAIQNKNYKLAVELLSKSIQDEQNYIKEQINEHGYGQTIKTSIAAVDSAFDELGVSTRDRAEAPDADHIHIIPGYLFYAQYNKYSKDTLGFVYDINGHVFINNEALEHGPNGDRSPKEKREILTHIVTHEVVHGTSTSNYHKRWEEINGTVKNGTEEYPFSRRLGAKMTRRINKNGKIYIEERGRALNEGLTESLNRYILQDKLGVKTEKMTNAYPSEREIVDMVGAKFDLKKQDLYKFLINRKFGKEIIGKVYGNPIDRVNAAGEKYKSYERPGYITLLMELMDTEHLQKTDRSLPMAKNFVNNKPLTINKSQSRNFHPSLINKDGSLKEEILQAYPFITQA